MGILDKYLSEDKQAVAQLKSALEGVLNHKEQWNQEPWHTYSTLHDVIAGIPANYNLSTATHFRDGLLNLLDHFMLIDDKIEAAIKEWSAASTDLDSAKRYAAAFAAYIQAKKSLPTIKRVKALAMEAAVIADEYVSGRKPGYILIVEYNSIIDSAQGIPLEVKVALKLPGSFTGNTGKCIRRAVETLDYVLAAHTGGTNLLGRGIVGD